MNYIGTIIEESLTDKCVLTDVKILSTHISKVTEKHQTPWLEKWSLHKVEVPEEKVAEISERISHLIDETHDHPWYADYKNKDFHYIIFPNKVFKIARRDAQGYGEAKKYGISLGIPEYQVDFSPDVE